MIGTYYRLSLADEDVGADKAESNSIRFTFEDALNSYEEK